MISSWVDLTSELDLLTHSRGQATPPRGQATPPRGQATPPHIRGHWCSLLSHPSTPPHPLGSTTADYLRMLREAQSVESSIRGTPPALISRCSTCRNSGTASPKSPPNSPIVELADGDRLDAIYINRLEGGEKEAIEEFLWDWSSRPSNTPPKWPQRSRGENTTEPGVEKATYSGRTVASLLLTNLVSLLLGAGLGVWIYRKTGASRGLQILIA